ncbi:MAG TPA: DNA internalization-related competence protein ComEC/Rec2 [Gammaproteobacteria bacterium]
MPGSGVGAAALGALAGNLAAHALPALPGPAWHVALAVGALALLRVAALRGVVFAVAAFAWTVHAAGERLADRLPRASLGADFAVTGWIDSFPTSASGQSTFGFTVDERRPAGVPRRIRLTWYSPPETPRAGERWSLVVRLRPPRGLRNPGGFDYERSLLTEGFGATGYVRSAERLDTGDDGAGWRRAWLRYRASIAARLAAAAPDGEGAALLTALAIGERFGFEERHWTDFRRTGTSHLVAVSGMHVALLGMLAFAAVRWATLRLPPAAAAFDLECAALAAAAATVYYAALTGFAVPAQRSLVMILVALAVLASRRYVAPTAGLGAALLLVLAWDPFAPLAASFWLSFGAVCALLLLASPRRVRAAPAGRGGRVARLAAQLCGLQTTIGIALLPLTAVFFGEVSLVGPLVNLAAIPWFNLVLVPLTLLATLALPLGVLGELATQGAALLAGWTLAALHALAAPSWAALAVPTPGLAAALVACAGTLLALPAHALPARRLAWLALLPLFVGRSAAPEEGAARLRVLDVGHGLAVLVETRAHRLLFDAGARYPSGFDVGREVVLPVLGGARLDKLVVSHADNDHAGGAAAVLEAAPDVDVLKGPDVTALGGIRCRAGQRWTWDGVEFRMLHPPPGFAPLGNETSCVLAVHAAGHAALVTGDIEARAEARLARDAAVAADVVVVPHHGSATSSSAPFVAATDAAVAVVSAGYANRWGFPRPDVRERWERAGATLWVTGDRGAVTVDLGPSGVAVRAERDRGRRYWHAQ